MSKTGRPPLGDMTRKSQTFRIRITEADREMIDDAASSCGAVASEWARDLLVKAAARLKRKQAQTNDPVK